LLNQGFYLEFIGEYGRILDKERAIIYEKEKGKPIDKVHYRRVAWIMHTYLISSSKIR